MAPVYCVARRRVNPNSRSLRAAGDAIVVLVFGSRAHENFGMRVRYVLSSCVLYCSLLGCADDSKSEDSGNATGDGDGDVSTESSTTNGDG
ncbi:MAG TPA: hypothetical protein VK034_26155, partial [Enhygromyxa sp.]|nr:hypothetical protein [Enhygromyxa sp.]